MPEVAFSTRAVTRRPSLQVEIRYTSAKQKGACRPLPFLPKAVRFDERGIFQFIEEAQYGILQIDIQRRICRQMQPVERVKIRNAKDVHQMCPERIGRFALNVWNRAWFRRMFQEFERHRLQSAGEIAGDCSVRSKLPDVEIDAGFKRSVVLQ